MILRGIPEGLEATLVLLRHGQSVYLAEGRFQGQADSPLSAVGLASKCGLLLALPVLLIATGFFRHGEMRALRAMFPRA